MDFRYSSYWVIAFISKNQDGWKNENKNKNNKNQKVRRKPRKAL